MDFKKYNSIENSYQIEFLNEIKEQGFNDLEYVVQEKVHGANLSFITNGKDIISAKRTELKSQMMRISTIQSMYSINMNPK